MYQDNSRTAVVLIKETVRSHEILTYDLLAIGIDMGPDNIVPL